MGSASVTPESGSTAVNDLSIGARHDRRASRRFATAELPVRVALAVCSGESLQFHQLTPINISSGGLCASAPLALEPGYEGHVAMALLAPSFSLVFAKIRVVWRLETGGRYNIGAEFIESTSGLFGSS